MKLIDIKILGYVVLALGFFIVSLRAHPSGGTLHAMCIEQWNKMPQQETASRDDVIAAMEKVSGSAWNIASTPPVGGALIMLLGGILIDVGSRLNKARKVSHQEQ